MSEYRISTLARKLEEKINNRIEIIKSLGTAINNTKIEEEKDNYFLEMRNVVLDLQPVVQLVKVQHPELGELFDTILAEHEAKSKICPTCNK